MIEDVGYGTAYTWYIDADPASSYNQVTVKKIDWENKYSFHQTKRSIHGKSCHLACVMYHHSLHVLSE